MGEKKKQKKTTKKKAVAKTAAKRVLKNPDETLRISPKATETMVLAADRYMNEVGKTSSALTKHRKSKTIQSQDVHLATRLTFKERYQSKKIEYTKAKNDKARQKAIKKLEEKKRKEKEKEKEKKQNKSLKKRIKGIEKNTKGPQFKHIELLPIKIEASDRNKSWKKIQRDHKKNDPLFTEISKDYRSDVQRLELKYAEINEIAGVTANSEDINKVIEEYNKDVDMLNKNLKYYNIPKEFGKAKRDKRGKRKSEGASEQKSQKEKWGDRAKKRKEWAAKSEEKLEKLREEQRKLGEQLTPEPIKVGHHSEGKHRKLASRMQNLSREISKLEDQKQEHLRKAENLTAMSKTNKGDAKTRAD